MNKNNSLYIIFLTFWLVIGNTSAKADVTPDTILKSSTYSLIEALKKSKSKIKQNPQIVHDLVTRHIAPQLDFIAASRWVLGKHWPETERAQKIRFIKAFRKLLIQFYSVALAEYVGSNDIDHGIITFLPLRKGTENDQDVTVYSTVMPPHTNKKVSVNYHMHKTRKGWKIYDVAVEGISMIGTYKSSFEPQLRNVGVAGLIDSLVKRNNKLRPEKLSLKKP